jgi:hypothetical protein
MKKIELISFFVLIFLFISTAGCLYIDYCIGYLIDQKNDLDFHYFLYTNIEKEGNNSINNIVDGTAKYNKTPERLTQIAELITKDFTDPFWTYQKNDFCTYGSNDTSYRMYFGNTSFQYTYRHDKRGRVRIIYTNDLSFDPNWIAYQKTGACQELAVFFNETANRSGFVTRIIRSNNISHFWNEVYIDNQWKTFDAQKYGDRNNNSMNWSGKTVDYPNNSDFSDRCKIVKCGVYVLDSQHGYGENITQSYDPLNECPHGVYNSPDC